MRQALPHQFNALWGGNVMRKFLATTAAAFVIASPAAAVPLTVDLAFVLDESGSVGEDDYGLAKTALSNALAAIPYNDPDVTYRVGIVTFSQSASTNFLEIIDSEQDRLDLQAAVLNDPFTGNGTNTEDALLTAYEDFLGKFGTLGDISLLNITTDGKPTRRRDTCLPGEDSSSEFDETCALAAGTTLTNAGWGISAEAVGSFDSSFLLDLVSPGPGVLNPATLDPVNQGFVLTVADFDAYSDAIAGKVQTILDDTGGGDIPPIPLPAGLPLLLGGLGVLGLAKARKKK